MKNSNLQGKICLVTGSTSGIGKVTSKELANEGATVVLVSRDRAKGEATQAEIKQATGNANIDLLIADLSLLQDVRRLANEFQQKYNHLHILVNNAGSVYSSRKITSEGLEATLVFNYLAPFLLTNLLVDTLKASGPARVINVSTMVHSKNIDFDNLQGEKSYTAMGNYGQAKLALIIFTYELARRLEGSNVTVNVLHPGLVRSNFNSGTTGVVHYLSELAYLVAGISVEKGAETALYLATSPQVNGVTGKYFTKKQEGKSAPNSYDRAIAQHLWQVSEQLSARAAQPV